MQYNILTNNNTSWVNCSRFICFICSNSHIIVADNQVTTKHTHTWQSKTIQDSIKSTKLHVTLASFPWHLVINCSVDDSDCSELVAADDWNYQKNIVGSWKESNQHSNLSNKPLILIAPLGYIMTRGTRYRFQNSHTKMWETL